MKDQTGRDQLTSFSSHQLIGDGSFKIPLFIRHMLEFGCTYVWLGK